MCISNVFIDDIILFQEGIGLWIYLNNAATSYPKPHEVADATANFILNGGSNLSRGSSGENELSTMRLVYSCREKIADLFGCGEPELVTFTSNVTESLNIVLKGYIKPGMRVLTSGMEHNAVIRPLRSLEACGVSVDIAPCSVEGELLTCNVDNYDLVVISHASNVCGTVQDISKIGRACSAAGVPFVVDAAQTAGVIHIDSSDISALCFTGHKGLFGPQGTGGIVWNREFESKVSPFIEGGTGSFSHIETQPDDMPDKFESGTPNLPGIAGLSAALDWLKATGIENILSHERALGKILLDGLNEIPGIKLYGKRGMEGRLAVFPFNITGVDNAKLARELSDAGFETRPGLHCSPVAHKTLGSFPEGCLRVSPGWFNTEREIKLFLDALSKVNLARV